MRTHRIYGLSGPPRIIELLSRRDTIAADRFEARMAKGRKVQEMRRDGRKWKDIAAELGCHMTRAKDFLREFEGQDRYPYRSPSELSAARKAARS